MQKQIYAVILFSTLFCLQSFGQAFPPVINSYTDTLGFGYDNLYISFSPNDTGVIKAQVQLQQGIGNNVYDSTYTIPAGDTTNVLLAMDDLIACSEYSLLINMSNGKAQGQVINPLLNFTTTGCTGITLLNQNQYSVIAFEHSLEVKTDEIPQNGNVEIYDITGRQILNTNLTQTVQQIPFNQSAGIYLLRITGNGQALYTNRFMIL